MSLYVKACEPTLVGRNIEDVKKQIDFNNANGISVRMLNKILYYMRKQNLTIVPTFL